MKLTNVHGTPPAIVDALSSDQFDPNKVSPNILWTTKLIGPPMVAKLEKLHYHQMEMDITEIAARFAGSAVHERIRAKSDSANRLQEERAYIDLETFEIITLPVGVRLYEHESYDENKLYMTVKLDCYEDKDKAIEDYKFASVWVYIFEHGYVKPDVIAQLNIYHYAMKKIGFDIDELRCVYWFKDWSKTKAATDSSYPQSPIISVPLRVNDIWSDKKVEEYIQERVKLHVAAMNQDDIELVPHCTDEERWAQPTKYAVMKVGNKRAVKLHNYESEANKHVVNLNADSGKDNHYVELRPGKNTRCEDWCNANKWCPFYQKTYMS